MSYQSAVSPSLESCVLKRWELKFLPIFALLATALLLSSCGSSSTASTAITCVATTSTTSGTTSNNSCTDPTTGITVTISPAPVSVNIITSLQFNATVSGSTDIVVKWQVNGVLGGNSTTGTIDSNGVYHAPATVPSPATVNVGAVSYDDSALSATSAVTILPAPTVMVSPTSYTIVSGSANTKTFAATVTGVTTVNGVANTNVNWYVSPAGGSPILGGNSTIGTINANGLYTAPATPPTGSTVTVSAAAQAFPLATASAPVTISGYSTSSLMGQFAFSLSGRILSGASAGFFSRAGSFTADGFGNLSGGLEDINETSGVTSGFSFVGTYTVSPDGRGVLKFADPHGATNNLPPAIFDFVLVSGTQLQITGFDASAPAASTYIGTAFGQANAQVSSVFLNTPLTALSGTYVFDFSGVHGSNALSMIGEFSADGAGHITGGSIDVNDGGSSNQFQITGSSSVLAYSISGQNGRGSLTLTTNDATFPTLMLDFYVVTRSSEQFVGVDSADALAGAATQQNPNAAFDLTSLSGNAAFLLAGSGTAGSIATATAGSVLADGNGNFTSGMLDENINGTPNAAVSVGGTYFLSPSGNSIGRYAATLTGSRTYVFYLSQAGSGVFLETDSIHPAVVAHGFLTQQQTSAFTLASILGNYAMSTKGLSASSDQVISGQFGANGTGSVTGGAIDINTAGTLTPAEAVTGTYTLPSSIGRSTLVLNPSGDNRNFAVYVVNSTQVIVVGIDSGRVATGLLNRQF